MFYAAALLDDPADRLLSELEQVDKYLKSEIPLQRFALSSHVYLCKKAADVARSDSRRTHPCALLFTCFRVFFVLILAELLCVLQSRARQEVGRMLPPRGHCRNAPPRAAIAAVDFRRS